MKPRDKAAYIYAAHGNKYEETSGQWQSRFKSFIAGHTEGTQDAISVLTQVQSILFSDRMTDAKVRAAAEYIEAELKRLKEQ